MEAVIVDTNVIVYANGTDDENLLGCVKSCQSRLFEILNRPEIVLIDDDWRILREYRKNTNPNTKKGIGDLFVKELLQNQTNTNFCRIIRITPLTGNGTEFNEFPDDPELTDFDSDDRKFIAVGIAYYTQYQVTPSILLAIDRGWIHFIDTLQNHGVQIELICEEDMQQGK